MSTEDGPRIVHPGTRCKPVGATGVTKNGTGMVCRLNTDSPPADGWARWGRAEPLPPRRRRRGAPRKRQGLEKRYVDKFAATNPAPGEMLPQHLLDQLDDKQTGALRRAAGLFWGGKKPRKTDMDKLTHAGLLDADGQLTRRGLDTVERLGQFKADPGISDFDEQQARLDEQHAELAGRLAAPAEDRSGDAGTDWSRYGACSTCRAAAGQPCHDLGTPGSLNAVPHTGRPAHQGAELDMTNPDLGTDTLSQDTLEMFENGLSPNEARDNLIADGMDPDVAAAYTNELVDLHNSRHPDRQLPHVTAIEDPGLVAYDKAGRVGVAKLTDDEVKDAHTFAVAHSNDELPIDPARRDALAAEQTRRGLPADRSTDSGTAAQSGQNLITETPEYAAWQDRKARRADAPIEQRLAHRAERRAAVAAAVERERERESAGQWEDNHNPRIESVDRSTDSGTDWSRYDACPTCSASAGQPCRDLGSPGSLNAQPHEDRPLHRFTVLRETVVEDGAAKRAAAQNAGKEAPAGRSDEPLPTVEDARQVIAETASMSPSARATMLTNLATGNEQAGNTEVANMYREVARAAREEADRRFAQGFVDRVEGRQDRSGQSGTDWSGYGRCDTCGAAAGQPCHDLGREGSLNATAHPGRPTIGRHTAPEDDPASQAGPWDFGDDDIAEMRARDAAADRRLVDELAAADEHGDLTTHEPDQACGHGLWHTGPCAPKDPPYDFEQVVGGTPAGDDLPEWAQRHISEQAGSNPARAEQLTRDFLARQRAVEQGLGDCTEDDLLTLANDPQLHDLAVAAKDTLRERRAKAQPQPSYEGAPISGAPSTGPASTNEWGIPTNSPVAYHNDGPIGTAVKRMGSDAQMDIDGLPLHEALGRVATDVVRHRRSSADALETYKTIRDRLPAGSRARAALTEAITDVDSPFIPAPDVPADAPAPMRRMVADLYLMPMCRGQWRSELDRAADIARRTARGELSRFGLERELRSLHNSHHESYGDVGKDEFDLIVERAMGEMEQWDRHQRLSRRYTA